MEHTFGDTSVAILNILTLTAERMERIKYDLLGNLRAFAAMRYVIAKLLESNKVTVAIVSFHDNRDYIKLALDLLLEDKDLVAKIPIICVAYTDQTQRKATQMDTLCQAFNIDRSVTLIDDDAVNIKAAQRRGWCTVHADVALENAVYMERIMQGLPPELSNAVLSLQGVCNIIHGDDNPRPSA